LQILMVERVHFTLSGKSLPHVMPKLTVAPDDGDSQLCHQSHREI
jgi:hypothetical protein